MNIRSLKNTILFALLTIYILAYKLFLFPHFMKYSELISASFFVILFGFSLSFSSAAAWDTVISLLFLGFRKDKSTPLSKNVFKVVLFYLILLFLIMYGLGIHVGFLRNAYSRSFFTLLDNIFAPIAIILMMELWLYLSFVWV